MAHMLCNTSYSPLILRFQNHRAKMLGFKIVARCLAYTYYDHGMSRPQINTWTNIHGHNDKLIGARMSQVTRFDDTSRPKVAQQRVSDKVLQRHINQSGYSMIYLQAFATTCKTNGTNADSPSQNTAEYPSHITALLARGSEANHHDQQSRLAQASVHG
jgi:hypothetical protein